MKARLVFRDERKSIEAVKDAINITLDKARGC